MNKSMGAFHSAFTVLEPSGSGAFDCDPGGAHSGIGWRLGGIVWRLFCRDTWVALAHAGGSGCCCGEIQRMRTCATMRCVLKWRNVSHFKFWLFLRMQRLPNLRTALGESRAL